jgi:hypothetical protein
MPTAGGEPLKILEGVVRQAFVVLDTGIYYIDWPSTEARLQYYDFSSGRSSIVSRGIGTPRMGLTASSDGRTVIYSITDSSVENLMLVENFQ